MVDVENEIVYKDLKFLGYPKHKVGTDGSVWRFVRSKQKWKKLKCFTNNKATGHTGIMLCRNKRKKFYSPHRLVLLAFVGPCPEGMVARHFPDRNPRNNRLENLSWGTFKQNTADMKVHGTDSSGERNGSAKLTKKEVLKIRELSEHGMLGKDIAKQFNVTPTMISYIILRRNWNAF